MEQLTAEKVYIETLKKMSGSKRVRLASEMYDMACHIAESSIRNQRPDLSDSQVKELALKRVNQ